MVERNIHIEGHDKTIMLGADDKLVWVAFCITCNKILDEGPLGEVCENARIEHQNDSPCCSVVVGLLSKGKS